MPAPPRKKKKKGTALVVVLAIVAALLLIVDVVAFAVPRVVAWKIEEAAQRRALVVKYSGLGLPIGTATLRDVTIQPQGSDRVVVTAPRVEAPLDGLWPSSIRVPNVTVAIKGSVEEVLASLSKVREADAKLPPGEKLPVDVLAGSVRWKDPLGEGSMLTFGTTTLALRPKESRLDVALGKGKLTIDDLEIAPLDVKVKRTTSGGERMNVTVRLAADDGSAELIGTRDDEGDAFALTLDALPLAEVGAGKVAGIDLRKAKLDGEASGARSADGALETRGNLTVSDAKLPPIKVSGYEFQIGGQVIAKWKGSPKKGAPGTLVLDEGSVEVKILGKSLIVTLGGEVTVGPKGEGPYAVHLKWSLPKVDCAVLAAKVASGPIASMITGTVSASGTIDGDPTLPAKLKLHATPDVQCSADPLKALPSLPLGLPKALPQLPRLR